MEGVDVKNITHPPKANSIVAGHPNNGVPYAPINSHQNLLP